MNTWTVHIENFGKIKNADIEAAPLTLFVGDNNSGKSYIMTLIYGLINVNFYYDGYQFNEQSENYKKCQKLIDRIYDNVSHTNGVFKNIEMTRNEVDVLEKTLNEVLSRNKEKFVMQLFNKSIRLGRLSLTFKRDSAYALMCDCSLTAEHVERLSLLGMSEEGRTVYYGCGVEKRGEKREYNLLIAYIIQYMIRGSFEDSIYFPTARTGYVLTYKTLVGSALKDKFSLNQSQKNLLTRPNSDFLAKLGEMTKSDLSDEQWYKMHRTQSAMHIIENNIIKGQVILSDMPSHDIMYQPQGTDTQFPLFVTSGVVTEMTPLLLYFRNETVQTVLIEEPEISLHPRLQCEMARVLVRLANSKIPVFVTTHSDIILQHINNMIKLSAASNCKVLGVELGYEACDWIEREKVNVYQFDADNGQGTTVTKLPCGQYGFEAMTFYDTLEKLNRQTEIIEGE